MPAIRVSLAFVNDDAILPILYTLPWENSQYSNLKVYSQMKRVMFEKLIAICNDPETQLSKFKTEELRKFITDNQKSFNDVYWKTYTFRVVVLMYEIIKISIDLIDYMSIKFPVVADPTLLKPTTRKTRNANVSKTIYGISPSGSNRQIRVRKTVPASMKEIPFVLPKTEKKPVIKIHCHSQRDLDSHSSRSTSRRPSVNKGSKNNMCERNKSRNNLKPVSNNTLNPNMKMTESKAGKIPYQTNCPNVKLKPVPSSIENLDKYD